MFVHPSFRHVLMEFTSKFYVKVSQVGYISQPLIRKHPYLDYGYLGRSASVPWVLASGFMPRGGAGGQTRTPLKSVCLLFCYGNNLCRWLVRLVGQTWLNLVTLMWRSPWPIFHSSVILPHIMKTIWWMNIIVWDNESAWPDVWPPNKCWSLWPIFHNDLKINVGHCNLYFMVQWLCLISWRLFDVWISFFGIMSPHELSFDLQINVGHCDLYFMVQWFCVIYLEDYWMYEHHTLGLWVSMIWCLTSRYM